MTDKAALIAEITSTIQGAIERLLACACEPTGSETILAWGNGLAVTKVGTGQGYGIASIERAAAFTKGLGDFSYPVVMNGNRETAKAMLRRDAALAYVVELRKSLAHCTDAANLR